MKILKLPNLLQSYDYDCGATAVQMVMAYYGIYITGKDIMEEAQTDTKGTPFSGLVRTIKKHNLKFISRKMTIDEVKKFIKRKIPVIILLQAWDDLKKNDWKNHWWDGHYVVAIGYDKNRLVFQDPASIYLTYLTFEEFQQRWHDQDSRNKKKYINRGIAVFGKKPKYDDQKMVHLD